MIIAEVVPLTTGSPLGGALSREFAGLKVKVPAIPRGCGGCWLQVHNLETCADPENFLRGVQIPRRGLTENFNMAKTNNLAIPGGGVWTPCPASGSAHVESFL